MSNKSRRVGIYRNDLLPWSETFIREQALALREWRPIFVGQRSVVGGLQLDDAGVTLLSESASSTPLLARVAGRMGLSLGLPYWPHVMKLRSLDLDLINAHFGTDATDIWPIAHALKIPMLVTLHGYDINTSSTFWESGKGGPHRIKYPKMLLHMASDPRVGFIAVSEAIKRSAIAFGIPPEKIIVSHIGVDTEYFKPGGRTLTERKPRILFVGRFVEQKGPLRMIRAFAEVAATIPDCELVMLGDGPLIGEARDLAHRLGLNVMFPGVLDRNQVVAQMHEARLLCFPSSGEEGLGMVLLEAQACGLPVISTARGGALEAYIEGETGITCAESDIACLARNLVRCLVNDDLTLRMSANAIDFIRSRFKLAERSLILESLFLMHIQQEAINAEAAD